MKSREEYVFMVTPVIAAAMAGMQRPRNDVQRGQIVKEARELATALSSEFGLKSDAELEAEYQKRREAQRAAEPPPEPPPPPPAPEPPLQSVQGPATETPPPSLETDPKPRSKKARAE